MNVKIPSGNLWRQNVIPVIPLVGKFLGRYCLEEKFLDDRYPQGYSLVSLGNIGVMGYFSEAAIFILSKLYWGNTWI